MQTDVGTAVLYENIILWTIPSFSVLPKTEDIRIWSPLVIEDPFLSLTFSWHAEVPKGSIGLKCRIANYNTSTSLCIKFGVMEETGKEINSCYGEWNEKGGYFRVTELCKLNSWNNVATRKRIFCQVMSNENLQIANASIMKENMHAENVNEVIRSNNSSCNAEDVKSKDIKNLEKLSQHFKELFISGQDSDLTINVKGHEFKAHKGILRARSSVFNAMFSHELTETKSSVIPIEDCEPDVFEEFLFFVYSGRTREISSANACQLYYVADKYLIPELKEDCICLLKKSLAIETICDIICLSTKCTETELLDIAIKFFASNMQEILLTVKWQLFMKENPTEANELIIKALKFGFTKKENLN